MHLVQTCFCISHFEFIQVPNLAYVVLGTVTAESFGDSLRNAFNAWICATVTLRNDSASGQRAVLPTDFFGNHFSFYSAAKKQFVLPLHQTRSLSFLHASDVRQQGPWGE